MTSPLFRYTTTARDLATADDIIENAQEALAFKLPEAEYRRLADTLERLVTFLEGKVDAPAKPRMISALRLKAQMLLELSQAAEAVACLNQALDLSARYGENEVETATIFELLYEHSPEFREGLKGLADLAAAIPSGS